MADMYNVEPVWVECNCGAELRSSHNAVSEKAKDEGPTLSQIMVQLKVILAEQSVVKSCMNVCNAKIDNMQKNLKRQEELVTDYTKKIEAFEIQNTMLQRENDELKTQIQNLELNSPRNNLEEQGVARPVDEDVIAVVEAQGNSHSTDYYWKEYTGTIPEDALPGGTDSQGKTTYVGQTVHNDRLVPGELDPTKKMLFYTMEEKQNVTTKNIKILCVRTPDFYEWIRTNIKDIRFLNQKHLIAGGHYSDYPYFIGRTVVSGRIVVGKIYYEKFSCTANDDAFYVESNFEVLSYNPKLPARVTIKRNCSAPGNNVYNINIS